MSVFLYFLFYLILQGPDGGNGDFYRIAGVEEAGRIEADADAAGRTGSDDVAREEGRALGNGVDQFRDSEDKFTGRTILTDFVIDLGNDVERIRSGIAQEDIRPDGAEGIQALAVEPLDVVGLQVPGRDVVEDSETVDVVHGFADGDVRTFLADDDGQFAFIVDLRCDVRMGVDEVIRADDRRRSLGEDDRIFWRFRHGCLGAMMRIVSSGLALTAPVFSFCSSASARASRPSLP